MNEIKVFLTRPDAKIPFRKRTTDAGWDLCAVDETMLLSHDRTRVKTGVILDIPNGYYGQIFDRSGNSIDLGIKVMAGVVDSSFKGEIEVILHNTTDNEIILEYGQKIAQIVFLPVPEFEMKQIWSKSELSNSTRGETGFGASGTK
jgi:dUTP pyrophosphatase